MKVRLLKEHLVNGNPYAPGTELNFVDSHAQHLVAEGVAEPAEKPAASKRSGPIAVPDTKASA